MDCCIYITITICLLFFSISFGRDWDIKTLPVKEDFFSLFLFSLYIDRKNKELDIGVWCNGSIRVSEAFGLSSNLGTPTNININDNTTII